MAWTAPRTWVAGETVTAAMMNAHLRDNFKAIGDPWLPYGSGAASWTAATTNPAIGNGTWDGRYTQAGKLVSFRVIVTMGSTTTYGSGQWRVALPVAPVAGARQPFLLDLLDTGVAGYTGKAVWDTTASAVGLSCAPTSAGSPDRAVSATAPFTWGSGDVFTLQGSYEGA